MIVSVTFITWLVFTVYVTTGGTLTPKKVFTTLSLVTFLRLTSIHFVILNALGMSEGRVALKRIQVGWQQWVSSQFISTCPFFCPSCSYHVTVLPTTFAVLTTSNFCAIVKYSLHTVTLLMTLYNGQNINLFLPNFQPWFAPAKFYNQCFRYCYNCKYLHWLSYTQDFLELDELTQSIGGSDEVKLHTNDSSENCWCNRWRICDSS